MYFTQNFATTYLLVLTNIPTYMPGACSTFRGSFPRRFLHPVYHQAQGRSPVLPAVCVQPARHPAARRGGGPRPRLPVWGPAWQACPGGVPPVPLHQPCWRQVSDWLLPRRAWTRWRSMWVVDFCIPWLFAFPCPIFSVEFKICCEAGVIGSKAKHFIQNYKLYFTLNKTNPLDMFSQALRTCLTLLAW